MARQLCAHQMVQEHMNHIRGRLRVSSLEKEKKLSRETLSAYIYTYKCIAYKERTRLCHHLRWRGHAAWEQEATEELRGFQRVPAS